MGNSQSAPPPPPPPAPPAPSVTLPLQRVPVQDGASGLHYSGRMYTNQFQQMSQDICQGQSASVDQINDVMPNSVSTTSLPVDDSTKRISTTALQGYVNQLQGTGQIPGQLGSFDDQMKADQAFYTTIQAEYCFYEIRYVAAIQQFLSLISNPNGADPNAVQGALNSVIALNSRLNSLLEILNYVGNDRAQKVNARGPQIDAANQTLDEKLAALEAQRAFLTSGDVRVKTQAEMIRFSGEKARAMNTQIMFFVALNVVALGTVLTVFKSMGAGTGGA
jgi:hypothetical protein